MSAGRPLAHDSALLHVTGRAQYTDDIPLPADTLHVAFGTSPVAHGRLRSLDLAGVLAMPGVVAVATAADIPGENNYGAAIHDDPIFATDELSYHGQPLFAVAATTHDLARRAARAFKADIEELPALLDIRAALAAQSFVLPTKRVRRGDPDAAIAAAPHRASGSVAIGGQDHFYLEGRSPRDPAGRRRDARAQLDAAPDRGAGHRVACPRGRGEPGHRDLPAHGRRLRRQGEPAGTAGRGRRIARAQDGAAP